MDTFAHFPTRLHWTAQQLTDAVPLRLHELYAFDASRGAIHEAANGPRRMRPTQNHYVAPSQLPARFGIR